MFHKLHKHDTDIIDLDKTVIICDLLQEKGPLGINVTLHEKTMHNVLDINLRRPK